MKATADSKVRRRIWVKIREARIKFDETAVWFPKRVMSKCPATILAIRRTAKVRGRIILLMDSIKTIKGMRGVGVLWGTKCANICFIWLNQPNIIKATHKGKLRVRVKARCLVDVKMYGNSPSMLLPKIKKKTEIKTIVGLELLMANKILNSDLNFLNSLEIKIKFFLGRGQ